MSITLKLYCKTQMRFMFIIYTNNNKLTNICLIDDYNRFIVILSAYKIHI